MKFRYLIAVPFLDHGSDVCSVRSDGDGPSGSCLTVVRPVCTVSRLDFSLLQPGFESLPSVVLRRPRAEFSIDTELNEISYRGFPDGRDLLQTFSNCSGLARFLRARHEPVDRLWHVMRDFCERPAFGSLGKICDAMDIALPYLASTATYDELVFDEAQVILSSSKGHRRLLIERVLRSSFTRSLSKLPPHWHAMKRVALPLHQPFVCEYPADAHLRDASYQSSFLDLCGGLQEREKERIWTAHVTYTLSEHLAGLWASFIACVCVGMTSNYGGEGADAIDHVGRFPIRELLADKGDIEDA